MNQPTNQHISQQMSQYYVLIALAVLILLQQLILKLMYQQQSSQQLTPLCLLQFFPLHLIQHQAPLEYQLLLIHFMSRDQQVIQLDYSINLIILVTSPLQVSQQMCLHQHQFFLLQLLLQLPCHHLEQLPMYQQQSSQQLTQLCQQHCVQLASLLSSQQVTSLARRPLLQL